MLGRFVLLPLGTALLPQPRQVSGPMAKPVHWAAWETWDLWVLLRQTQSHQRKDRPPSGLPFVFSSYSWFQPTLGYLTLSLWKGKRSTGWVLFPLQYQEILIDNSPSIFLCGGHLLQYIPSHYNGNKSMGIATSNVLDSSRINLESTPHELCLKETGSWYLLGHSFAFCYQPWHMEVVDQGLGILPDPSRSSGPYLPRIWHLTGQAIFDSSLVLQGCLVLLILFPEGANSVTPPPPSLPTFTLLIARIQPLMNWVLLQELP